MRINYKKLIVILLGFLIVVVLIFVGTSRVNSNTYVYEKMWKIDIPNGFKEIYSAKSDIGFTGDGIRYSIYEYNGEPIENVEFVLKNKSEVKEKIDSLLTKIEVEESMKIDTAEDFQLCVLEKNNDTIIFCKSSEKLYVVQETQ
ncbi:MAG: hypothetical protein J6J11_09825 [Treponema sp.]|nr:hypothetical protein [Clostridia bacterium]MBP3608598.1 hypothetical protein [Treponema sp.]